MKADMPPIPVARAQGWPLDSILRRLRLAYQKEKAERRSIRKQIAKIEAARKR